jgi:hypothetical protein
MGVEEFYRPPAVPWLACHAEMEPWVSNIEHLKGTNASYRCSTQNVRVAQPCMCCVFQDCWRDIRIVANSSRIVRVRDVVTTSAGERAILQRYIPQHMQVCYKPLSGHPQDPTEYTQDIGPLNSIPSPQAVHMLAAGAHQQAEGATFSECRKESGRKVALLLRAIEVLRGWGPAGDLAVN